METNLSIAVLIPCLNEAPSIGKVVDQFKQALPSASIYVYDNNSKDDTVEIALNHGAIVRSEKRQGKGNVVRRMFSDIDADIYIMVDGDGTYDISKSYEMVKELITHNLDMVTGSRKDSNQGEVFRPNHKFGNWLFTTIVARLFGQSFDDILTGYRVMSKRFIKSFPALSRGFEIETELTIHALDLRVPVSEIETNYYSRLEGSTSKLNTYGDGLRIILTIILFLKEFRPMLFFTSIFAVLSATSLILSWPILMTYLETGLVPRFPTAILSTGMMIVAIISLTAGIILDSVTRGRREAKRMHYLQLKSVSAQTANYSADKTIPSQVSGF